MNLKDYIGRLSDRYGIPSQLAFAIAEVETGTRMDAIDFDSTWQWLWDWENNRPFRRLTDDEILSCCAPSGFSYPPQVHSCPERGLDREFIGQKSLWGPFAARGSLLRSVGYPLEFLALLDDPQLATHYSLRIMQELRDRYFKRHGWSGVAAAWQTGRPRKLENGEYVNQDYLRQLTGAVPSLRKILWVATS
jgi:hypothetical protein